MSKLVIPFIPFASRDFIWHNLFKPSRLSSSARSVAGSPTLTMAPLLSIVFGSIAATYLFLRFLLRLTQDRNEPPAILTGLPFISPLIGMATEKTGFHTRLRYVSPVSPVYESRAKQFPPSGTHINFQFTHCACPSHECTLSMPQSSSPNCKSDGARLALLLLRQTPEVLSE